MAGSGPVVECAHNVFLGDSCAECERGFAELESTVKVLRAQLAAAQRVVEAARGLLKTALPAFDHEQGKAVAQTSTESMHTLLAVLTEYDANNA
jgi:hypothetical protein